MDQSGQKEALINAGCTALGMEITPLCDYQQGKVRLARFICGVVISPILQNLLKNAEYIRQLPAGSAFNSEEMGGDRVILWDSHYIVSISPNRVPRNQALFRLRHMALMDIQAWAGSHASRPGYLSVR